MTGDSWWHCLEPGPVLAHFFPATGLIVATSCRPDTLALASPRASTLNDFINSMLNR